MKRLAAIIFLLACISAFSLPGQVVYGGGALSDTTIAVMQIKDAVVVSSANPVKVVADTVEYNPAALRLAEDAMLEDVLRRIPGLEVNDGVVTLHGKVVKQLLIDGKRFFAGDIKAGLQNISADMISKVRAYERESDFTRMTGVDDGEREAVLDLKVKKSMLGGWNGNVAGGYGQHSRYRARASANKMEKNSHTSVIANFNNLNGTININNASRNQLGGGSAGDADRRDVGVSLSRKSKTFNADASLHYGGTGRNVLVDKSVERIYGDGRTFSTTNTSGLYNNHVPKFEGRFEWTPRKNFSVLVKPNFKYTGNRNSSCNTGDNFGLKGELKSSIDDRALVNQDNFNASVNMIVTLRNLAARKGRSLSFSLTPSYTDNNDYNPQSYNTRYPSGTVKDRKVMVESRNTSLSVSGQVSYNEPLGKGFFIQTTLYSQIVSKGSDRKVFDLMAANKDWTIQEALPWNYRFFQMDKLSAQGRYRLSNSKLSLNMRYSKKKINLTAGISFSPQFSRLDYRDTLGRDTLVRKMAFFVAPNLNFVYRPRENERLSLTYNANANAPGMYSLIPVSSGTNPLYIHYGNESLLPSYTHKIELTYNMSNAARHSSVVATITARILQNQVSNLVKYDSQSGGTVTTPYNIAGNWDLKGSMAYNKTFGGGFSLIQHASFDYVRHNSYLYDSHSRTNDVNALDRFMFKESLDFQWRNSWLELIGNIGGDLTSETCSLRPEMNQLPYSLGTGLKANFSAPWSTRLNLDYSFLLQRGYVMKELNRNYNVLNISLSHPFPGRRFILSVEAFDILGQLPNLTRVFSQSSRSISLYNGYNRYVIVRAVYKFRIRRDRF